MMMPDLNFSPPEEEDGVHENGGQEANHGQDEHMQDGQEANHGQDEHMQDGQEANHGQDEHMQDHAAGTPVQICSLICSLKVQKIQFPFVSHNMKCKKFILKHTTVHFARA
jgi:hypothetical protein